MEVLEAALPARGQRFLKSKMCVLVAQNHIPIINCDTLNELSRKDVRPNPGAQDPFATAVKTQQYSPTDLV